MIKIEERFCEFQPWFGSMKFEIVDFIKRDRVWTCIENVIKKQAFFKSFKSQLSEELVVWFLFKWMF